MKILHIGQMIGGLDVYIRNSITYSKGDFEYVIVHGIDDKNKPVYKNDHEVKEYLIPLYRELNIMNDCKSIIQTIKIIHKEKPDIIHCHSAKGGVIGRIAGFVTHTKTFYTPHAFSFLSSNSKFKKWIYIFIERITRLNSYLLACSDSEWEIGINIIHYKEDHALVWNNSVPDSSTLIHE